MTVKGFQVSRFHSWCLGRLREVIKDSKQEKHSSKWTLFDTSEVQLVVFIEQLNVNNHKFAVEDCEGKMIELITNIFFWIGRDLPEISPLSITFRRDLPGFSSPKAASSSKLGALGEGGAMKTFMAWYVFCDGCWYVGNHDKIIINRWFSHENLHL